MSETWMQYEADFNALTDAEIERESEHCRDQIDEAESWLEAVASWKEAGKPRTPAKPLTSNKEGTQ